MTFAGISPAGTSTVSADVVGRMIGSYTTQDFTGTVNPSPAYAASGNLGTFF